MTVEITVDGTDYDVPSSAADTNWAAAQVAFEQALVEYVDDTVADVATVTASDAALSAAVKPTAVAGTAGSGTGISGASTNYGRHVVQKITVARTALTAAAVSQDVTLWTLPAKTRVLRVIADVTTKFSGGGTASCVMTVGNSAGGNEYLLSGSVFGAAVVLGNTQSELGASVMGGTGFASDISWSATTVVQARFTADINVSSLTQGAATFYIECCTYP